MQRQKIVGVQILSMVLLGGCSSAPPTRSEPVRESVEARVDTVLRAEQTLLREVVGTLRPRKEATISSQLMGRVMAVHFAEGDTVRQGKLLLEIDAREANAQLEGTRAAAQEALSAQKEVERTSQAAASALDSARANAQLAESTYQRFEELFQRGSVSPQEFEEARARRSAARAELSRAKALLESVEAKAAQVKARQRRVESEISRSKTQLSHAIIRAPFSGRVTSKQVEVGDLASPGQPLLKLEEPSRYRLHAALEESLLYLADEGQTVDVEVQALKWRGEGRIDEISPQVDPVTRTLEVKVSLPSIPRLRSGLYGTLRLPSGTREILSVAAEAVIEKGQLTGVYVIDDDQRARFRLVETGSSRDGRTEILSGLSEGEKVVVSPPQQVSDGTPIKPAPNRGGDGA